MAPVNKAGLRVGRSESHGEDNGAHDLVSVARRGLMATSPSTSSQRSNGIGSQAKDGNMDTNWLNRIADDIQQLHQAAVDSGKEVVKLRAQVAQVEDNYAKQTAALDALRQIVVQKLNNVGQDRQRGDHRPGQHRSLFGGPIGKQKDLSRSQSTPGLHASTGPSELDDPSQVSIRGDDDDAMQIDGMESSAATLRAETASRDGKTQRANKSTGATGNEMTLQSRVPTRPTASQGTNLEDPYCAPGSAANDSEKVQTQHVRKPQVARRSQDATGRMRSLQSGRSPKPPSSNAHSEPSSIAAERPLGASDIASGEKLLAEEDLASENGESLTEEQESAIRVIKEAIACMQRPPRLKLPENPVSFPPEFLRTAVGGNAQTFATVSEDMVGNQIMPCEEIIKVNPSAHEHAPKTGYHGALTFVDGCPNVGKLGKGYPLFWKNGENWEYGGFYKVNKRMTVPVEAWDTWGKGPKEAHAAKILGTGWGHDLLRDKGIVLGPNDADKKSIQTVIAHFERNREPCLRMSWTILQCVSFDRIGYDLLVNGLKSWTGHRPKNNADVPAEQSPARRRGPSDNDNVPTPKGRGAGKTASGLSSSAGKAPRSAASESLASPRKRVPRLSQFPEPGPSRPVSKRQRVSTASDARPRSHRRAVDEEEMSDSITVRHQPGTPGRERQAKRKRVDYRLLNPELDDVIFGNGSDEDDEDDGEQRRRSARRHRERRAEPDDEEEGEEEEEIVV